MEILFRHVIHAGDNIVRIVPITPDIEVALDGRQGGFRLALGSAVGFYEIIEIGNLLPVGFCCRRVIINFIKGLFSLLDKGSSNVGTAMAGSAGNTRSFKHRRISDQGGFEIPTATFVQHDFAAGHVFLVK